MVLLQLKYPSGVIENRISSRLRVFVSIVIYIYIFYLVAI